MRFLFHRGFSFFKQESASSIVLILSTLLSFILANSGWASAFESVWKLPVFQVDLRWVVNEALMTLFFFVIGLELKRECVMGELRTASQALKPKFAALGGVLVPALIFICLVPVHLHQGWAIPTATDIAFSLGVIRILGHWVSKKARIFLTALAIMDDLAAVLVIALFYNNDLGGKGLLLAIISCLFLWIIKMTSRFISDRLLVFGLIIATILLWTGLLLAHIHPILAGFIAAFFVPIRFKQKLSLEGIEKRLHGWVSFGVMPLFALANAGVVLDMSVFSGKNSLFSGIFFALVVGKPVGIFCFTVIYEKIRSFYNKNEEKMPRRDLLVLGSFAGIGFTMSLFISQLAYKDTFLLSTAKLAIVIASLVAMMIGVFFALLFHKILHRNP